MDVNNKISANEAIALIVIIIVTQIILNLPNTILKQTGNGILLNTVYISIIVISFSLLICKLFKPFQNKDILEISEYLGGKTLKNVIGILYILFFLLLTSTLIRYFSNALKLIYFENTPLVVIIALLMIPALAVNRIRLWGSFKSQLHFYSNISN